MKQPVMVAYGAGVDSTALLVGLWERGDYPDAILFADTCGEKPETYHFLFLVDRWLAEHGFAISPKVWHRPPGYDLPAYRLPCERRLHVVQVVVNDGKYGTLERNCLELGMLPSIAYGRRACSEKYKQRPQHKWARRWPPALAWWSKKDLIGRRRPVRKLIGYDADESWRGPGEGMQGYTDDFYEYFYPLRLWGWRRADCLAALERAGLPVPLKSACFFCPSSKKREVLALADQHPELFERAVRMERTAAPNLDTVKGLGRSFSWEGLVRADRRQLRLFADPPTIGCTCVGAVYESEGTDGEED
jgi:hypothetical protein